MVHRGHGTILNMCSTAGFQPGAYMSVYYATKAFVLSFTEALSVEMQNHGISVTAYCPGPTNTGFVENANLKNAGLFKHLKNSNSKEVAHYGYMQMRKKKVVVIYGVENKILAFFVKLFPRKFIRNLVCKIQK